jgi:hypothetical protein
MRNVLIALSLLLTLSSFGQLTENSKFYLLTCEVGDEVYTQFGHSALRIKDPQAGMDITFNWGMFEFTDDPVDFNYKFAKGRLPYYMDVTETKYFLGEYAYFNREVRQQELNLTVAQKTEIWKLLEINALPENLHYQYDFFFDNCATRIRDIFEKALGDDLTWSKHPEEGEHTFREMIDQGFQSHPWLDFGIDLVLGYKIDAKVDNRNLMFNPFYMEDIFELSQIETQNGKQNLVLSSEVIVPGIERSEASGEWFTPVVMTVIVLVITLIFAFFKLDVLLKSWASILFLLTGVLGVLLFFMWFQTDHSATKGNLNLLWANPLWLVLMVAIWIKKWQAKLASTYLYLSLGMLALVLFFLMLPQEFHPASRILIVNWAVLFYFFYRNQILKEKQDQKSV